MNDLTLALEKVFKCYQKYSEYEIDLLFELLNALDEFNKKLLKFKQMNLFHIHEFTTLSTLRSYYHQNHENRDEICMITTDNNPKIYITSLYLTLLPTRSIKKILASINKTDRENHEKIIKMSLQWYDDFVNLHPCIFNFMVKLYEFVLKTNIQMTSSEFHTYQKWYQYEEDNHFSHFTTGKIKCLEGNLQNELNRLYSQAIKQQKTQRKNN